MRLKNIKDLCKLLNNEKYYPFYLLILSAVVLFFQLDGSIGNWDEAIYSEVAREGLLRNNWIDLYYKENLWFEKPPFVIWLTMVSYKIFGINEFAAWFFPVIFGILGILGTYYLAKNLFNSKIGFLSALILLSVPHYLLMSRNNMMDIFLVSSSVLSFLFLIKSKENGKYLFLSVIFLGVAFMSKNIIAFLNLPVFFFYLYLNNQLNIFKSKYFYFSIILFLIIILPWHLIMFLRYKQEFLDNYVGYHLFERYNENILHLNNSTDIFNYLKVIILRSGSWWFVFLTALLVILKDISKKIRRQELLLLLFWMIFIFIFFTFSTTKLHHYILPLYIPFSILIAYSLYSSYLKKSIFVIFPILILFMNIDQSIMLQVSNFGETRLLFSTVLYKFFYFPIIVVHLFITVWVAYIFYCYFSNKKSFAVKASLCSIFLFSFILPFNPDRAPLAKEIGRVTENKDIEKIYHLDYKNLNIDGSLVYYNYPIKIIGIRKSMEVEFNFSKGSSSYCLMNKKSKYDKSKELKYDFYPCEIIK